MLNDRPLLSRDGDDAPIRRARHIAPAMTAVALALAMGSPGVSIADDRRVVVGADPNGGCGGGGGSWQDYVTRMAQRCDPNFAPGRGCPVPGAPNGCDSTQASYVPVTVFNDALIAAGGTGTWTFAPDANFKLQRLTLDATTAADLLIISIANGANPNLLPSNGKAAGVYFSATNQQDGSGRVTNARMITPGQKIIITAKSTAGGAAGAIPVTLEGVYAGY